MQGPDGLLDALSASWRSAEWPAAAAAARAEDLAARVRRGSRRMRLTAVLEAVLTVVVLVAVGMLVPPRMTGGALPLWLLALAHTALVWGFVTWNRRGLWEPIALETEAYLSLLRTRAQRRLVAARFMSILVAVEAVGAFSAVAILSGGLANWSRAHGGWVIIVGLTFGAAAAGAAWTTRRARRELSRLAELEAPWLGGKAQVRRP